MFILVFRAPCYRSFPLYFLAFLSLLLCRLILLLLVSSKHLPFVFCTLLWVGSTRSDVVMIEFGVQVVHYESTHGGGRERCEKEVELWQSPNKALASLRVEVREF